MSSITLENVTIDFPIYGSARSFRKALFSRAAGGLITHEDGFHHRVTIRALDDVSIHFEHGDRVGVIGHNGAGKSTLLRVLAGVYAPTRGDIVIDGSVSALFNTSPGLDMEDTGYENLLTCGIFLGMTREEIIRKRPEIEEATELGDYLNLPMRTYSSGMIARFGFALATSIDPDILILDEGLGVSDARFAERAKRRIDALVARSSILILASHSDELIRSMCSKAVLLHAGRVVKVGAVGEVLEEYHRLTSTASS